MKKYTITITNYGLGTSSTDVYHFEGEWPTLRDFVKSYFQYEKDSQDIPDEDLVCTIDELVDGYNVHGFSITNDKNGYNFEGDGESISWSEYSPEFSKDFSVIFK